MQGPEYLVSWEGYPDDHRTWVPLAKFDKDESGQHPEIAEYYKRRAFRLQRGHTVALSLAADKVKVLLSLRSKIKRYNNSHFSNKSTIGFNKRKIDLR